MTEIFNNFWSYLFLIVAAVVVIQLIMSIISGTDLDIDIDGDGVADFDLGVLVSPKGILHFLFGGSGYLTLIGKESRGFWDFVIAVILGIVVAGLMALLYWGMSKLACEKKQEEGEEMIGRTGTIYLVDETPGTYEITVTRNGRQQQMMVKSKSGREYKTGEIASICEFSGGIYYIE